MSFDGDIQEVASTEVDKNKEQTTFAGTIMTVSPEVTVQTDGSGVAIPVKVADFVSLVEGRRCILQRVGKDTVLTHTYGGNVLGSLNITGDLTTTVPAALTSTIGAGAINTISAYAALSTPASLVFTTPASGRVSIKIKGRIQNPTSSDGLVYLSYEIRTGGTVGAGTIVVSASNGRAYLVTMPAVSGAWSGGRSDMHTLIPKTTYNVQAMGITSNGGGTFNADSVSIDVSAEV